MNDQKLEISIELINRLAAFLGKQSYFEVCTLMDELADVVKSAQNKGQQQE